MLKPDLRALNRDIYGDLPARVAEAYTYLCAKQTEAMNNPQTSTFEATLASHFGIEEQFFYQRSWIQCLDLGDQNTRFYHTTLHKPEILGTQSGESLLWMGVSLLIFRI